MRSAAGILLILVAAVFLVMPASADESAPGASFTADTLSGTAPLTVQFTDTSSNSPTSWSWTFGDGGTSTAQSPSHTYTTAGTYSVSLTATNAGGSGTVTKTSYITVSAAISPPVASFAATVISGTAPLTVQFIDASGNTPTSWSWTFGDGGTSTEQSPSHTYTTAGTYSVSLTATNAGGSGTVTKTSYITVSSASTPAASFTADVTSGTESLTVQFTDTSTNSPTAWAWLFGDGEWSSLQNPSHTYSAAGTYTVALTVTNSAGSSTVTETDYVVVSDDVVPVASFTADVTSGTESLTVQFTDTSTNSPTSWVWYFGDGTTSTEQDPEHTYDALGTFTVILIATNSAGSDTVTETDYITVTSPEPVASFSMDVTYGAAPLYVQFTDTSTNSPTSWTWSFGDGTISTAQNPSHTYSGAGTYTVTLTVANSEGSDAVTKSGFIVVYASATTVSTTHTTMAMTRPTTAIATVSAAETANLTGTETESPDEMSLWAFTGIGILVVAGITGTAVAVQKIRDRYIRRKWQL